MVKIIKAKPENLRELVEIRLEMLREVNHLSENDEFSPSFIENCEKYFKNGHQTTVLAFDEKVIGCASMCYLEMMPTFAHPTGKRAHIMNVYTQKDYRRQGLARAMLYMLIEEAKENGVTEITLDATEKGIGLYKSYGFVKSEECMTLNLGEILKKNIERIEKHGLKIQESHHCG